MQPTPLAGTNLIRWIQLIIQNGFNPRYTGRLLLDLGNILLMTPLYFFESIWFGSQIRSHVIKEDPIFIIGHWRSGTTHLHNLMIQDPTFGYISTLQSIFPYVFLTSQQYIKRMFRQYMPSTRPMDNMKLSFDTPQEDEVAIACVAPYSFQLGFSFPQNMQRHFKEGVLFENLSESQKESWKQAYYQLIQKVSLHENGKRLVLKNPSNTARVKTLLELFPNAKFIHIYRNPYIVFESTKHLHRKSIELMGYQPISEHETEENVLVIYQQLLTRFYEEQALIPPENYVEIQFEKLEENPLAQMRTIYEQLKLPGFEKAAPLLERYLEAEKHYEKNQFRFSPESISLVSKHWQAILKRWQYEPPSAA